MPQIVEVEALDLRCLHQRGQTVSHRALNTRPVVLVCRCQRASTSHASLFNGTWRDTFDFAAAHSSRFNQVDVGQSKRGELAATQS